MRRVERLFQIIAMLRNGRPVTAQAMAERLEVSPRTVYRDIVHLQAEGLPIDGVAGLGFVCTGPMDLAPLTFSRSERDALALGLSFARRAGDADLAAAALSVLAKIGTQDATGDSGAGDIGVMGRVFGGCASVSQSRRLGRLRRTLRAGDDCTLIYRDRAGAVTRRRVQVTRLLAFRDGWIVEATCALRQARRSFRLDRIVEIAA